MNHAADTARHAETTREDLLRYLADTAPGMWAEMIRLGTAFTAPEAWSVLPPTNQAEKLTAAEARRVTGGPLYAAGHQVSRALIDAASAGLLLAPEILPAASGSIYFHTPIADAGPDRVGAVTLATWGPPPPAMGLPGMWLSWYTDVRTSADPALTAAARATGVLLDQEHFLRFFPAIDQRLIPGTAPAHETARILRIVLLTLFGISQSHLPVGHVHPTGRAGKSSASSAVGVIEVPDHALSALPGQLARAAGAHAVKLLGI